MTRINVENKRWDMMGIEFVKYFKCLEVTINNKCGLS